MSIYEEIPQEIIDEINFMLGSHEECQSDYLKPILERHGYSCDSFLMIEAEDDMDLAMDIYKELFC